MKLNVIKVNNEFSIFINKYLRYDRIGKVQGRNVPQKHLCFFFKVNQVKGYHKFILKNRVVSIFGKILEVVAGKSPKVKTNIPNVDENYVVLSKSPAEAMEITKKINAPLTELAGLFPFNESVSIDRVPTNLELHITNKYVFVRTDYKFGYLIDQIYPLLVQIQKRLLS